MTGVRGVYGACVFFDPPTVLISFYSKNLSDLTNLTLSVILGGGTVPPKNFQRQRNFYLKHLYKV